LAEPTAFLSFITATNRSKLKSMQNKTYVLVHGAWMGAWVWQDVANGLKAQGATVAVVELPAHGADTSALPQANLSAYVQRVNAAIDSASGPVILVGHSMGGMVVTQAAEERVDRIQMLVYLAAYLPKNGQKLLDLALTDADSHSGRVLQVDEQSGLANIPADALQDCFLADGSAAAVEALKAYYRPEPLAGFIAPVQTTPERWGSVKKAYFYTQQDHAISYPLQQRMSEGIAFALTHTFDSSHSPFLSRPAEVVAALASLQEQATEGRRAATLAD
jgi:pimeloyl-ACP methyl ester carboxylesterase